MAPAGIIPLALGSYELLKQKEVCRSTLGYALHFFETEKCELISPFYNNNTALNNVLCPVLLLQCNEIKKEQCVLALDIQPHTLL